MVAQPIKSADTKKIEVIPSKELFITMLVKDITLKDAIGDLVDNSVDAAIENARDKRDLSSFSIDIVLDKNHFEIIDNCGGIEEEIARTSAFKLGKPKNYDPGKHTIGQFGIGMKRAFFKLGEHITVESIAPTSSFRIVISVLEWRDKEDEKDWEFTFDTVGSNERHPPKDRMTKIIIKDLKKDAKKQFANPQFLIDVINKIALDHLFAINKGLTITINKDKLKAFEITLIHNDNFQPCYWKYEFPDGLIAEIIAGASEDVGDEGGWYIFCNDRLILGPDTTAVTGWVGGRGRAAKELPKYHDQFFRFRGYVFFNADDSSKLPWNTSKTGMDKDSPSFVFVKEYMIKMGKQVKGLLDDIKKEREKDNPIENRILSKNIIDATQTSIVSVLEVIKDKDNLPVTYKYPKHLFTPAMSRRSKINIVFTKPKKEVEKVKNYFDVENANDAGSLAFDYFYKNAIK